MRECPSSVHFQLFPWNSCASFSFSILFNSLFLYLFISPYYFVLFHFLPFSFQWMKFPLPFSLLLFPWNSCALHCFSLLLYFSSTSNRTLFSLFLFLSHFFFHCFPMGGQPLPRLIVFLPPQPPFRKWQGIRASFNNFSAHHCETVHVGLYLYKAPVYASSLGIRAFPTISSCLPMSATAKLFSAHFTQMH